MTTHPASNRGLRLLALCAVGAGLLLLAATAFVLSYTGVRAVALDAGVSPRLARLYPLILDGMVVVAGAAVLSLRSAGLPSRWYAWLSLLVMLAADAGADTVHAVGTKLPHKPSAAAAAIIPWALVLVGFGLLLAMLRHARLRADIRREASRASGPDAEAELDTDAGAEAELDTEAELDDEADLSTEAELDSEAELGVEDLFQAEDDIDAPAVSGAEPESAPGLVADGQQFDRVHSTPAPPEA